MSAMHNSRVALVVVEIHAFPVSSYTTIFRPLSSLQHAHEVREPKAPNECHKQNGGSWAYISDGNKPRLPGPLLELEARKRSERLGGGLGAPID
jgi:hypothetical protein